MCKASKIFSIKKLLEYDLCVLITSLFILNTCSQFLYAQPSSNSATASISATIANPIGIKKIMDMSFGNVAAGASSGTLILNTSGARSITGGITLPSTSGNVTPASFKVTGEGSFTYTITITASTYISLVDSVSKTMLVNNFTSSPSGVGTLISGTQTIYIGATLNVGANQPTGEYENNTGLVVTVNYN